jgi:hypothetical protein
MLVDGSRAMATQETLEGGIPRPVGHDSEAILSPQPKGRDRLDAGQGRQG